MQWFASSQLKSKDPRRRMEALGRVADARDRQTVAAVMSALGDAAVEVRLEALKVIVRWRDENTVRALTHATRDPHPDVRERAISELRGLGLRESIPDILPCLCDMAMPVRTAAVQALNMLGWMPVTPGERALEHIGLSQFGKAAALGRACLELLLPFVDHAAATTRREIAAALGLIRDPQAVAALQKLMGDVDPGVRIAAITAMAAAQQPVAIIARGIADPDKNVRLATVETLGELKDSEAVPMLSDCLKDEHWEVRCAAAGALALLGERSTLPLLIKALTDIDADMRVAAAEALGMAGDVEAIEPLILAQLDSETRVRQAALRAVVRVDYRWHRNARSYQTLPFLKRALRNEDYSVRNAATELLERIFSIRRPAMRTSTADPEADRRAHAAEMLIPCLWDDDPFLRGAAAEALGQLRSSRARDVLKVKAEDPDKWVRQQAMAALVLLEGSKATAGGGWRPSPAT
jgi:HEAT repeat protein